MLDIGNYIVVLSMDSDKVEITSYDNIYQVLALNEINKKWLIKEWVSARIDNNVRGFECVLNVSKDEDDKIKTSWIDLH